MGTSVWPELPSAAGWKGPDSNKAGEQREKHHIEEEHFQADTSLSVSKQEHESFHILFITFCWGLTCKLNEICSDRRTTSREDCCFWMWSSIGCFSFPPCYILSKCHLAFWIKHKSWYPNIWFLARLPDKSDWNSFLTVSTCFLINHSLSLMWTWEINDDLFQPERRFRCFLLSFFTARGAEIRFDDGSRGKIMFMVLEEQNLLPLQPIRAKPVTCDPSDNEWPLIVQQQGRLLISNEWNWLLRIN